MKAPCLQQQTDCLCGAVLASVSLKLQRGTITALVGRSGAGKSTIASVLSRFYAPAAGEVLLNGHPSSSFTRGEWARAVALVSQETSLFEGERMRCAQLPHLEPLQLLIQRGRLWSHCPREADFEEARERVL